MSQNIATNQRRVGLALGLLGAALAHLRTKNAKKKYEKKYELSMKKGAAVKHSKLRY
jgi:hypothetical protein